ncbi:outer membrane protein assembly factor BamC [Kushneria sp. AK178]
MSRTRWIMVTPLLIALGGCGGGYYHDRNSEYADAEMTPPLELPASRNQARYQNAMPVPQATNDFIRNRDGYEPPRPQTLSTSDRETRFVEPREADGNRWLVVSAAPGAVWPRLQEFVRANGYQVQNIDGSTGQITTDRGVLSVRQGIRNNTTDVYCQQGGSSVDACLSQVSQYLSSSAPQGGVSMVAQNLSRNDRVRLESRDGNWRLALALDFPRAWAELAWQLENNYQTDQRRLIDQNRSERVFTVEYTVRGEGSWIPFRGSSDETQQYLLHVAPADNGTFVTVTDRAGEPVDQQRTHDLLDGVASILR